MHVASNVSSRPQIIFNLNCQDRPLINQRQLFHRINYLLQPFISLEIYLLSS